MLKWSAIANACLYENYLKLLVNITTLAYQYLIISIMNFNLKINVPIWHHFSFNLIYFTLNSLVYVARPALPAH